MSREVGLLAVSAYDGRQPPTQVRGPHRVQPGRLIGPSLRESGPSGNPGFTPSSRDQRRNCHFFRDHIRNLPLNRTPCTSSLLACSATSLPQGRLYVAHRRLLGPGGRAARAEAKAGLGPLSLCLVLKIFIQYLSHQIFRHMYDALNAVEKITYTF